MEKYFEINGITFDYQLKVYSDSLFVTSTDLIDPNFKIKDFDYQVPHTPIEWQSYCFHPSRMKGISTMLLIDVADKDIMGIETHNKIFRNYLHEKIKLKLVLVDGENIKIISTKKNKWF